MIKEKCPYCKKLIQFAWAEEALDVKVNPEERLRDSGQKVFLLRCSECSAFLGVVNKIE